MDLIIEDELPRKPVRPLGGGFGLGRLGGRDIEIGPNTSFSATKAAAMPQAGAQKMPAVHPELAGAGLGKILEPFLELSLGARLRQGVELAVRHHSSGTGTAACFIILALWDRT